MVVEAVTTGCGGGGCGKGGNDDDVVAMVGARMGTMVEWWLECVF